jgi:hypothetical protein
MARDLLDVTDPWDLSPEEIEEISRRRHMGMDLRAALEVVKTSTWPREGRWYLGQGLFPEPVGESVDRLLAVVPRLESDDPKAARIELTRRLYELYVALPRIEPGEVPELMRLMASLAFTILIAEREAGVRLSPHMPTRKIQILHKRQLGAVLNPLTFESLFDQFEDEMRRRGAESEKPVSMANVVTGCLLDAITIMLEHQVLPEVVHAALENLEAAMRDYEQRHAIGNLPEMELEVSSVKQLAYRNRLYLLAGTIHERLDQPSEAVKWFLKGIDTPRLPQEIDSYSIGLGACERLLRAVALAEGADRVRIKDLLDRTLAASMDRHREYIREALDMVAAHPGADLSSPLVKIEDRIFFFGGAPGRWPLTTAVLYRELVDGVPPSETSYDLFVDRPREPVARPAPPPAAGTGDGRHGRAKGVLSREDLSEFLFNAFDSHCIVTGGRVAPGKKYCSVGCRICLCEGDPPGLASKIPYVPLDAIRMGVRFIDADACTQIQVGDGLTRLSSEPFQHPEIYDILEIVCGTFPKMQVLMGTSGVLIDPARIDYLNSHENLHFSLSVHTLDEEARRDLMKVTRIDRIRLLLRELERVRPQMFDVGDTEIVERDLEELMVINESRANPFEQIRVRRIDHSRFHAPEAVEVSQRSLANFPETVRRLQDGWPGIEILHLSLRDLLTDERYEKEIYSGLARARKYCEEHANERLVFCVAESSHDVWERWLKDVENATCVLVRNHTYGGSYVSAGLMTFSDVEKALKGVDLSPPVRVVIPRVMLNRSLSDLYRVPLAEFQRRMGVPVDPV